MVTKYKVFNWVFNKGKWAADVRDAREALGREGLAHAMGVATSTIDNWAMMYETSYGEFPHPNMTNMLLFCNLLDIDVRDYFILDV